MSDAGRNNKVAGIAGDAGPSFEVPPVVFNLRSLGWTSFQDLCGTVLGVVLGQTVQQFRPTRDAGRDLAFEGTWKPIGGEALSGRFVVQCKHKADKPFYLSDLAKDLPKATSLVRAGRCETYLLMTNAPMTAATAGDIEDALRACGVVHPFVVGGDLLDRYIRETPRLRAMVPRLYGLGDLTQVLDQRRYDQAIALLSSMRDEISKFVGTEPYRKAVEAQMQHGFVLLLGAPASGKSMIASALAAASIDMWGCRPIRAETPESFLASWNPNEPDQFFWFDDAFGATQYRQRRADEWNVVLPQLRAAIARGARFVMTSRDYIWADARDDLKLSTFVPLETGQVVIDVHDLTSDNKRHILYNHLKYGQQPKPFRAAVKPFLERVVSVTTFLPEVARRLGDPNFTKRLKVNQAEILGFFEHPLDHLKEVVAGLATGEFAALTLLFMAQGERSAPIAPTQEELDALRRLGVSLAEALDGLQALRGSLVVLGPGSSAKRGLSWSFKHPTIADAVRTRIAARYELIEIYLMGAPVASLVSEVTCGNTRVPGALVVPERLFSRVAARLKEAEPSYELKLAIANFLVTRCSKGFLRLHAGNLRDIEIEPDEPGSVRIAGRLQELGLLAETTRTRLVAYFRAQAIDNLDLRILTDRAVTQLATPGELDETKAMLRAGVIDGLDWYIEALRDNYDGAEDPDDIVDGVRYTLEAIVEEFPDDREVAAAVAAVEEDTDRLYESLQGSWAAGLDYDDVDWRDDDRPYTTTSSIFDDVDE